MRRSDGFGRQTPVIAQRIAWRPRSALLDRRLSPLLQNWLDTPDSLTARVKASCRAGFSLSVLSEQWRRPFLDEARRLAIPHDQAVWLRLITLNCGDRPWVFARTVMPRGSLRGRRSRLRTLGKRPLGTVLFTGSEVQRGAMEVRRLAAADPLIRDWPLEDQGLTLWARRSTLAILGEPILVTEVFLSELDHGAAYRQNLG